MKAEPVLRCKRLKSSTVQKDTDCAVCATIGLLVGSGMCRCTYIYEHGEVGSVAGGTSVGNHIAEESAGQELDPRRGILLNSQSAHSPGGYAKVPSNPPTCPPTRTPRQGLARVVAQTVRTRHGAPCSECWEHESVTCKGGVCDMNVNVA